MVGVPLTVAALPDAVSANPAGSVPALIVHVYGGVPPDMVHLAEYAVPTVEEPGDGSHVIETGEIGDTIVPEKDCDDSKTAALA